MARFNRRRFILSASLLAGMPFIGKLYGYNKYPQPGAFLETGSADIMLGVISSVRNPDKDLKIVQQLGFPSCQVGVEDYSSGMAKQLSSALKKYGLKATSLICMGPGVYKWNLTEGPLTIGLVPREGRAARVEKLMKGIDFCREAGIPAIQSHFGFIPEDPNDVLYKEFIATMKPIGSYALKQGIEIYFETGQETPVTLLRAITDIGTGNLFVNYDTANLVLYGKANPLDGLKVIGKYVKSLHAKDGTYPTNPNELGKEVPIPEGEVNFPAIIAYLKKINFKGNITIEYELADSTSEYILKTKKYLESLIG
jgi:sugar phosphate isomerase/epimerase